MKTASKTDIVVIGASAGGVQTLVQLVGVLPEEFPAAIFIVVHISAAFPSLLPSILSNAGNMPATHAHDGEVSKPGHVYIAPPDHHLLLEDGVVRLSRGPKENYSRPAIDVLFRSAARVYGPRVVGVVLSGTLYDGTAGLIAIKEYGGTAIVQDPDEAVFAGMPRSAIFGDHPDFVLPVSKIAATLMHLAWEPPHIEEPPHGEPE